MSFARVGSPAREALKRVMRREQIAAKLAKLPMIEITCSATEDRTNVKNIIIWRTHAKRLGGNALKLSVADVRKIIRESKALREKAISGSVEDTRAFMNSVGEQMRDIIKTKIRAARLWRTGQLYRSIFHRLQNI